MQASLVDDAGTVPLLVVGSVPPGGRDLDLLVPDEEVGALEHLLASAGYEGRDGEWIRFGLGTADAVDVIALSSWSLPPEQATRLFADARPVEGYRRLLRPAPADELLILARRSLGVHAPLAPKHRRRIDEIVARDPQAWAVAGGRAAAWSATDALAALRAAHTDGEAPARLRARAAVEARHDPRPHVRARAAAHAALRPRPARGRVVALSGIDGSGKSTQAAALAEALTALGHDAVVEWSRITYDPGLRAIAAPVKKLLARLEPASDEPPPLHPRGVNGELMRPGDAAAQGLRERVPVVNHAWVVVVAVVHALSQRRSLAPHLRAGRVVVRDRYVLDATVQLEDVYGGGRGAGLPGRLLRLICPKPAAAFWLDVDPRLAYERKPEEYSAEELAGHRRHYETLHGRLGLERVDGSRDAEQVGGDLARRAWQRLR